MRKNGCTKTLTTNKYTNVSDIYKVTKGLKKII